MDVRLYGRLPYGNDRTESMGYLGVPVDGTGITGAGIVGSK